MDVNLLISIPIIGSPAFGVSVLISVYHQRVEEVSRTLLTQRHSQLFKLQSEVRQERIRLRRLNCDVIFVPPRSR